MSSLPKTTHSLAATLNLDPQELQHIIVNTVMPAGATNEEVAAFMIIANTYKLNPLLKQIAAFQTKGHGIMPMVMIDGWLNIMQNHPKFNGMEQYEYFVGDKSQWYVTTSIYVKGIDNPIIKTEYYDECYVSPKQYDDKSIQEGSPWDKFPKRMLGHKSLIQCIRYALGIGGIYDHDELVRIDSMIDLEIESVSYINGPMPSIPTYSDIEAAVKAMGLTVELRKERNKQWAYAMGDTFNNQAELKKLGFGLRKNVGTKKWESRKDVTLNLQQVKTIDHPKADIAEGKTLLTQSPLRSFATLQELSKVIEDSNHRMEIKPSGEKLIAKIDIDAEDEQQVQFAYGLGFVEMKGHFVKNVTALPNVA
jgi:phage recombination protein Bet